MMNQESSFIHHHTWAVILQIPLPVTAEDNKPRAVCDSFYNAYRM